MTLPSPQRLYYVKEAHGIVVTAVAFLPESRRGRELLVENEAALLSVAVDSRCKLHLLPPRRMCPGPVGGGVLWGSCAPPRPRLVPCSG